ncbi:MAG: hypothetical protein A2252_08400 [Elusimicrobia bacterium RIFOXYA2_FULL_39_19]|nr:MAG: hypothetical protein A2252_08400 [Elusimicrobia bacterium RIFOXYA2_FULL_39_19]
MFLVYQSFLISYNTRFFWISLTNIFPPIKGIPNISTYKQFFYLAVPFWATAFVLMGFYKRNFESDLDELVTIVKGSILSTILMMAITFVYRGFEYSRFFIGINWIVSTVLLFIWHEIIKNTYKSISNRTHNALIIGNANEIDFIKKTLKKNPHIRPFFLFEYNNQDNLFNFISQKNIEEVFVVNSLFTTKELAIISDKCEEMQISLKIVPDLLQLKFGELVIDQSLGIPVFSLKSPSLVGLNFFYKRIFDIFLSIIFLSLVSIPLAFVAFFIKIDSKGTILYSHKRMGYKSKTFHFYKFRTMVIDADILLEKIKHLTERKGPVFKMKNDPRITKFGKFLRKYSIDEIPQIINVLLGDMSLVGPRPQVLWEAQAYDDFAKRRLSVLPGVTGLWQVSGRASLSYEEMIELDIYYLENWSLGLDLKIIFKTFPAIFSKKGAY